MGIFFTAGEKKVRPGLYNRYENGSAKPIVADGTVATVFAGNWGPLNTIKALTQNDDISLIYGGTASEIIDRTIAGGSGKILAVRIGTGGTKGSVILKDTTATPVNAITATLKYEGDRALGYIIRDVLGDTASRELIITESGTILEKITFAVSTTGEVDSLIAAAAKSIYVDLAKVDGYAGTGKLALVASGTFTGGVNPTVTTESYSNGFSLLETKNWDCVVVDTNDTAVHAILSGFVNRMYLLGRMGFAVIGEPSSVLYDTRLTHAVAYNDYNTIYVGMGYINAAGEKIEGWKAAANIAGLVAGIPSKKSITHTVIADAVSLIETLTDTQYQNAVRNGMIAFSVSSDDQVWVDSGITTLTVPSGEDDKGWEKIKRVKIRFEMMTRISNKTEKLSGQVDGTDDGKTTVIQIAQGVLNDMVAEKKLASGAKIELVTDSSADPDSAYFNITAYDIDSLEKFYLVYKFRFSEAA
ncbi:phage tail sheath subtilisin-like domain-containing protein [Acetobacterium tundrae]|uniref:Tail sheath protein subtilisin-like domain-containing protein n=1 Tax=Acetobacterium tundrae TaxID=132932 RepID=A0ABR6WP17_9FIRM|nr:phage tail sheath subtilisin-like domain-containing protein [Acetobacterium tundrae]MBC3798028.1 hypothetical protein [Acetobacterium tundrae]